MQLHYHQIGEQSHGSPLVLLHGILGSHHNLRSLARMLSEHHVCYLLDLPNHGLSPRLADCSFSSFAQAIVSWMDTMGIVSTHCLGHSLGGKIAMRLATDFPERTLSLTALDIAPRTYQHSDEFDVIFRALHAVDAAQVASREEAQVVIAEQVPTERVQQFLLSSLRKHTDGYRFAFDYPVLEATREQWRAMPLADQSLYDGEALFAFGVDSDFVLETDYPTIKSHFPRACFAPIAHAGHWLHADNFADTMRAVKEFLITAR